MSRHVVQPLAAALAAGSLLFAAPPVQAQATAQATPSPSHLKILGSVRARYETIDGQARAGFNASDDLFNFRTRVAIDYDAGVVRFGAELNDSRAWGAETGTPLTTGEVNTLEFVQAFVAADFDAPGGAGSKASIQLGRFMLNLGSRRLVAADDYRNTTNGYSGLRLDAQWAAGASATGILVMPLVRLPDDFASLENNETAIDRESRDLVLFGGLLTWPAGPPKAALQILYFGVEERDRPDLATRDRDLDTFGLRWFRDPADGKLDFDFEALTQSGAISAGTQAASPTQDVSASYLHAEAGYRWPGGWKPRLAVEYDYASGDEPGGDYNRFDTLFGMRRSEIAPSGIYNAVGRANIASPGLRLEVEPSPRLDAFIGIRSLRLAADTDSFSTSGVRDATGAAGDHAGTQIDARVRYWLLPQKLRLESNVVFLDKGRFLQTAPNTLTPDDTLYLEFDATVSF